MRISDMRELAFCGGGVFSSEDVWLHPRRVIDTYELLLVTRGTVCIREGQTRYALQPGDYILLHPGVEHAGWRQEAGKVEFYWLHFRGQGQPEMPFTGSLTNPGILIQSARQLLQIHMSPAYPEGTREAMLRVLLAELTVQWERGTEPCALAAQTHEYIRSHSRQPLTAAQVAGAMGYSADHLSRLLKRDYGKTLRQMIVQERMNRARLLLQTSPLTISQLAFELGWKDPNLFEKFFRYHQKCTPTAYRQSFTRSHTNHR